MRDESAVSEIIGGLMLIGIVVGAFGIFTAIYLPSLIHDPIPHVKLSMACNTTEGPADIEYPCIRGSFNCHPFNNVTCEDDCKWRDYSDNPDFYGEQHNRAISRCLENCMSPICSDLRHCGVLYICHNGGDSLKVSNIRIVVNGNPSSGWSIREMTDDSFVTPSSGALFSNGDTIRILDPAGAHAVDKVMFLYSLPSGGEVTLAGNQFGTDLSK